MDEKTLKLFREDLGPNAEERGGALVGAVSNMIRAGLKGAAEWGIRKLEQYTGAVTDFASNPLGSLGSLAGEYTGGCVYNQVKADVQRALYDNYQGMRKNVEPNGRKLYFDGREVHAYNHGNDFHVPETDDLGSDLYTTVHEVAENLYMRRKGVKRLNNYDHSRYERMVLRALNELAENGDQRAQMAHDAAIGSHRSRLVNGDSEGKRFSRESLGSYAMVA